MGKLLLGHPSSPEFLMEGVRQAQRSRKTGLGLILSAGLLNDLVSAKKDDDLARRDALLDELRAQQLFRCRRRLGQSRTTCAVSAAAFDPLRGLTIVLTARVHAAHFTTTSGSPASFVRKRASLSSTQRLR